MYDIYLFKGVHDFTTLVPSTWEQIAPELKEAAAQQQLIQQFPHFLGVELDANGAINLLGYLRNEKAIGYIVPSAYRQPRVTVEQAAPIAEKAILKLVETQSPNNPPGPTHFVREEPISWVFAAIHGGKTKKVYVHVDKLDGHLWEKDEIIRLHEGA